MSQVCSSEWMIIEIWGTSSRGFSPDASEPLSALINPRKGVLCKKGNQIAISIDRWLTAGCYMVRILLWRRIVTESELWCRKKWWDRPVFWKRAHFLWGKWWNDVADVRVLRSQITQTADFALETTMKNFAMGTLKPKSNKKMRNNIVHITFRNEWKYIKISGWADSGDTCW